MTPSQYQPIRKPALQMFMCPRFRPSEVYESVALSIFMGRCSDDIVILSERALCPLAFPLCPLSPPPATSHLLSALMDLPSRQASYKRNPTVCGLLLWLLLLRGMCSRSTPVVTCVNFVSSLVNNIPWCGCGTFS